MRKSLRVALAAATLGTTLFVAAPPASATCRPERPSTCEAELPNVQEWLEGCSLSLDTGLPPVLGYCDL